MNRKKVESTTYLFFRNVQLVSFQYNKSVFPNFPENSFATELANPASFVRLRRLLIGFLRALLSQTENSGMLVRRRFTVSYDLIAGFKAIFLAFISL